MRLQGLEKHAGEEKSMAVKIERGGWVLIFLIGVALVGYSLNRYGVIEVSQWTGGGKKTVSGSGETVDASKPLLFRHLRPVAMPKSECVSMCGSVASGAWWPTA